MAKNKLSEEDVKPDKCFYDLCKKDSGLKQCEYCEESFCKNHLEAKVPLLSDMPELSSKEKEIWDRPGGHLCEAYKKYLQGLEAEQGEDDDVEENVEKHHFANCSFCHKEIPVKYTCESCGKFFCSDHRFPEKHKCTELKPIRSFKKVDVNVAPIKTILSLLAFVFLVFLVYFSITPEALLEEVVVPEIVNISEFVSLPLSFSLYADNLSAYIGKNIELKGFLFRSSEGTNVSVIKNYVVDDEDNMVEIVVLNSMQRNLLSEKGRSEEIYFVSGIVEKDIVGNVRLLVKTLVLSEREVQEIVSQQVVNTTILVEKETPLMNNVRMLTDNVREIFS